MYIHKKRDKISLTDGADKNGKYTEISERGNRPFSFTLLTKYYYALKFIKNVKIPMIF